MLYPLQLSKGNEENIGLMKIGEHQYVLCSLTVEINSLIKAKIMVMIQKSEPQGTMIIVEGSRACRFRTSMGRTLHYLSLKAWYSGYNYAHATA